MPKSSRTGPTGRGTCSETIAGAKLRNLNVKFVRRSSVPGPISWGTNFIFTECRGLHILKSVPCVVMLPTEVITLKDIVLKNTRIRWMKLAILSVTFVLRLFHQKVCSRLIRVWCFSCNFSFLFIKNNEVFIFLEDVYKKSIILEKHEVIKIGYNCIFCKKRVEENHACEFKCDICQISVDNFALYQRHIKIHKKIKDVVDYVSNTAGHDQLKAKVKMLSFE